jgi:asparagine synthase (glutamine-hydrolysing)
MSVSIENRSPYLDRSLFDWCQKIPTRHLVRDGRAKAVLRAAVKGLAPNRVIENPRKVGFNAPIFDFLDVNDRSVREAILDDGKIFEIVKRDAIEELVSKPELANSRSKFLFNFVNAKLFLEEFAN